MAVVRAMQREDLTQVLILERENFSLPWDEKGFLAWMGHKDAIFLVAREGGTLLGYCGLLVSFDEAEVTNVCVAGTARRQGIGRMLMEEMQRLAAERGVCDIHLDVRKSNTAARALYENMGYVVDGIRRGYYDQPREDAILMTLHQK